MQKYFERFLRSVMRSQVLKGSTFLVDFLRDSDLDHFQQRSLLSCQSKGPKNLKGINTIGGEINVYKKKTAEAFFQESKSFIETFKVINEFFPKKCKDIQGKCHELADEFYCLGGELNRFGHLLKSTNVPQATNMYHKMSEITLKTGDHILNTGELFNSELKA